MIAQQKRPAERESCWEEVRPVVDACLARLAVDPYGRVFVPNPFRFSVEMLDTNGNQIERIGRYGNAGSAGPGSRVPEPEIAFAWPRSASVAEGKLYVTDTLNGRVVVIGFDHATAAQCPAP